MAGVVGVLAAAAVSRNHETVPGLLLVPVVVLCAVFCGLLAASIGE